MSGQILIIDPVATNRIVLKVKLSAAFYKVTQASGGAEAIALARADTPDLVICASDLADMSFAAFVQALKAVPGLQAVPVIAMLARDDTTLRLDLLRAGAADVVTKPFSEPILLARLRSLLRNLHRDADLGMRADTAEALGLAEAPATFNGPGRIAVIGATPVQARTTCKTLCGLLTDRIDAHGQAPETRRFDIHEPPDVILLRVTGAGKDGSLSLLAELRAAPATRNSNIIVQLDTADAALAATVLDMGASDVVGTDSDPREIALRLSAQLRSKRTADARRHQVQNGLQAAITDPLTGLYNRRYALSHLNRLMTAPDGQGRPFAVMVADLDHFKSVNDTYGHTAGDMVLARVASQLRSNVGTDGVVARLGGEEFLIVLPESSRAAARQIAGRLCRLVREYPVVIPGQAEPVRVTISIGVTLARPDRSAGPQAIDNLISQADRALYGAKEGGRDTVTVSGRPAA